MKLFIKILLFVLVSLVTNVNVVSASIPFINIQEATTSSFHTGIQKTVFKISENVLTNCCQNEQNLVAYRDWGTGVEVVVAKVVGKALNGVDDVITNPSLLQGKSLSEVQTVLKNTQGWAEGTLTKGRSAGQGWTLRQLNSKGTDFTDLYIQYSPGSPRHFGGKPYWKVSSGNGGTQWFPAGQY